MALTVKHRVSRAAGRGPVSRCSKPGRTSAHEHEDRGDQLQVVRDRGPPRSAIATSRRNSTEPMTAPAMMKPSCRDADQRLADDDAGQAPDHHADAHLHVGEALVLRQQRAGQRDQAVGERQAEHDHVVDVHAERADHLRVVAGGAHRRAEVGAEEEVEDDADERRPHRAPATSIAASRDRHVPADDVQRGRRRPSADVPRASAIVASVRSISSGTLLFPMTCRLTE